MRIAVLGPLEVTTDDSTPLLVRGEPERLLLGVLVAAAPDVVPAERLVAALSDAGDAGGAGNSWRMHLAGLRSALQPGLPDRCSGQYVLRRGSGSARAGRPGAGGAPRFAA